MTPESPILAELQPLLDALCEESVSPEQLKRLEELVLVHPEAEQHYVRFMSFHADLIGAVAGLPERTLPAAGRETQVQTAAELISMEPKMSEPTAATPQPERKFAEVLRKERTSRRIGRYLLVLLPVVLVVGAVVVRQLDRRAELSRQATAAQRVLEESRDKLARAKVAQGSTNHETKQELDAAIAREKQLPIEYQEALRKALREISEKDCQVRVTGPTHFEPGAPNRWQIETRRPSGTVVRPKELEVVVKDDKDAVLLRQTQRDPVGAATLELPAAFWTTVKPGANLFLEVSTSFQPGSKLALADRVPLARPVYVTHLATDKPLYQPGEVIHYRSLTLDRSTLRPPTHDMNLRFRLRFPGDTVVPLSEGNGRLLAGGHLVMGPDDQPIRGLGVGEFQLPAASAGGEYQLELVEVDSSGKEVLLETRKFIVNRYVPDTFEKKLEFDGKSYGAKDVVQARVEVSRTAGGPMRNARATVVASVDGRPIYNQPNQSFAIVEEGGPKAVLNVRFELPADLFSQKSAPSATLAVTIQDGSDVEAIVRPIPLVTKTLAVDFYPEGGDLIEGVPARVYFQVRTPLGKPADLKGVITDGAAPLMEVATLTDAEKPGVNRGLGVFTLTPRAGATYYLKVHSPLGIKESTPKGYRLPVAKPVGVALTALDAVTPRGEAVRVRIQVRSGEPATKTLHVGAYARGQLIGQKKITVEPGKAVDVSIPGDPAAGGVTRITAFEELMDDAGRARLVPRAERLVYRVPGQQLVLGVKPDRMTYTPGEKVRLDISAENEAKEPAPAVLMVGVVNRSVITMADNKTDRLLPTHFLLSGDVRHPSELEHADFLLTDHPKAAVALDLLLGTQGWRRFAEQNGKAVAAADRKEVAQMLIAHGNEPSPAVELRKLEEQRITSEYRPKMEATVIRIDDARKRWQAYQKSLAEAIVVSAGGIPTAENDFNKAKSELEEFESRFSNDRIRFASLMALPLIGVASIIALLVWGGRRAGSTSSEGMTAEFGIGLGFVCILILILAIAVSSFSSSTNSKQALSFAESNIKDGGDRAPAAAKAAARARPGEDAFQENLEGALPELKRLDKRIGFAVNGPIPAPAAMPKMAPVPPAAFMNQPVPMAPMGGRGGGGKPMGGAGGAGMLRPGGGGLGVPGVPGVMMGGGMMGMAGGMMGMAGGMNGFPGGGFGRPDMIELAVLRKGVKDGEAGRADGLVPDLLDVPIFVVREYAHERDPARGEVRSDFTETVFWHPALALPGDGKASIEFQLADDVARYQVLVAGHTVDGRIGAIATTIEARKPVSIDPKLPLEISHTDRIDVPVRVTNDSDVSRTVSLALTPAGLEVIGPTTDSLTLGANGKSRRVFQLQANKLEGEASLTVEAGSKPGGDKDAITRKIRVVTDGFPAVGSISDTLEGRVRGKVVLPKDMVPGSLAMRLEVYPTSMADLVKGLDGLLREPGGCFEQTSTSNYPNVMVLDYLNQTKQANPQAAQRAKQLLDNGYGHLVSFECPNTPLKAKRGFEWFGSPDMAHEALTAYGLLQFKDMSRVHPVDPELIKRTQGFLLARKDGAGGFQRNAQALDQFGRAPKYTTDAYIVWALVESDPEDAEKLDLKPEIAALKKQALQADSAAAKDAYFLALTANVFLLRNDRETAYRLLDKIQKDHLKDGAVTGAVTSITCSGGRDLEIETTALALLGWLRANDPVYAPVIKETTRWLSRQRGGFGGFGSTQSTILALKALTLFARKTSHPSESGEFTVKVGGKVAGTKKFTEQDVDTIVLDIKNPEELFKPGVETEVEITTDGKQPYPFVLGYTFTTRTPASSDKCAVRIATSLARAEAVEGETVPLTLTLENRQKQGQGMAVAIVGLPAGLKVPTDLKQLTELKEKGKVSFFELRGRELILYWRGLAPEQKFSLTLDLVCDVPGRYRGPASRGYLYYDGDNKHWVEPLAITIATMGGK